MAEIFSSIPKHEYKHDLKFMYHGSPVDIQDKYVKPMNDGFEKIPYVYANSIRTPSLKFTIGGLGKTLKWGVIKGYTWFLEIYQNTFKEFTKDGYMYTLSNNNFELETYPTYISSKQETMIEKEHIKNVLEDMKKRQDCIMISYAKYKKFLLSTLKN